MMFLMDKMHGIGPCFRLHLEYCVQFCLLRYEKGQCGQLRWSELELLPSERKLRDWSLFSLKQEQLQRTSQQPPRKL